MVTLTGKAPQRSVWRSVRRSVWCWVRALAGIGILAAVVWRLGTGSLLAGFRAVDLPSVLAALVIGLATTVLCAWRWQLVAVRLGLPLPLDDAISRYYRALFLNNVLPAGVLGDVHRAVTHGRAAGETSHGIRAVVLERVAGQAIVVGAAVLAVLAGAPVGPAKGYLLAGFVLALVIGWFVVRNTLDGRTWTAILAVSTVALAGHVTLFVVAAHTAGVTASPARLVPLLVLALLAMGLPLNFAGWGPREGATAVLFGAAGLGSGAGLTTSVVYGVLSLVASLPGAWFLLRRTT